MYEVYNNISFIFTFLHTVTSNNAAAIAVVIVELSFILSGVSLNPWNFTR